MKFLLCFFENITLAKINEEQKTVSPDEVNPNYLEQKGFLGLLGENTTKSLSPLIHNSSAQWLGRSSHYEAYSLTSSQIKDFLESFHKKGGLGLNITNPHKHLVGKLVGETKLFSVNTLKRIGTGWKAYSTDGEGFWNALTRHDKKIESYEAFCFIGSGDVFISILDFLKDKLSQKPVYIIRRGEKNDENLKTLYKNLHFLPFEPSSLEKIIKKMGAHPLYLVQGTSAPLKGDDLSSFLEPLKNFNGGFCDLVYGKPSALYSHLKQRGFISLDGLPMLIEQAILAQKIWWGESASYEIIHNKLIENGFA